MSQYKHLAQSQRYHIYQCLKLKMTQSAIANGANTVMKVRDQTYATGGNGCCTRQVERLIECIHSIKKTY